LSKEEAVNIRKAFGLMVSAVLLSLPAGLGLAEGPQPAGFPDAANAEARPASDSPWFKIEVDTRLDTGQHTSVVFNPWDGRTYVSYYNATDKDLRVAYDIGSGGNCGPDDSWYCHTVDSEGDVGQYSSIAVVLGVVNVSYYDASNGDLKWAESSDHPYHQIWRTRTVDRGSSTSSTGLHTSLELPQNGQPYISYHLDNAEGVDELRIAHYVGGSGNCGWGVDANKWQCDTIWTGEGVGQFSSLALDGNWNRYIAYYNAVNGDLWMATSESGSNCGPGGNTWSCYPISGGTSDVGKYASLYLDSSDRYHIAYYDATDKVLKYAVEVSSGGNCGVLGSTQCETIDSMQADYHPLGISIAEDAAGYPVIAYQSADGSLNLARPTAALGLPAGGGNCGPEDLFLTWYCQTIDRFGTWINYRNGDFASIAISPNGLATIAYQGFITSSSGNLMVAYQRVQLFLPLVKFNQ
jgi:hypothetical protein